MISMKILLVGAGGVGDAIAKIAARRSFFEIIVVSDYDVTRAERTIAWIEAKHGPQGGRFVAHVAPDIIPGQGVEVKCQYRSSLTRPTHSSTVPGEP